MTNQQPPDPTFPSDPDRSRGTTDPARAPGSDEAANTAETAGTAADLPGPGATGPASSADRNSTRTTPTRSKRTMLVTIAALVIVGMVGIFLTGIHHNGGQQAQPTTDAAVQTAPGINQATSQMLSMELLPGKGKAAPDFHLTDQHGQPLSISALRGKVVAFSPNDDQCEDLCTLLANDIVLANKDLGGAASHVVWASVNANPFYPQVSAVKTWSDQHGLAHTSNWKFGTAAPATLKKIWKEYGFDVDLDYKNRTVEHSTEIYFIDPQGRIRSLAEFGTAAADTALFAHGIAQMANDLLPSSQKVKVAGPEVTGKGSATLGNEVSDFSLPTMNAQGKATAKKISYLDLRGRFSVINFWASTCTACKAELEGLAKSYDYLRKYVNMVGVDVADPAPSNAAKLVKAARVTYPQLADPDGTLSGAVQITGLPYTVILGPSGDILIRHPGIITTEQLEYILENYDQQIPDSD